MPQRQRRHLLPATQLLKPTARRPQPNLTTLTDSPNTRLASENESSGNDIDDDGTDGDKGMGTRIDRDEWSENDETKDPVDSRSDSPPKPCTTDPPPVPTTTTQTPTPAGNPTRRFGPSLPPIAYLPTNGPRRSLRPRSRKRVFTPGVDYSMLPQSTKRRTS